MAQRGYSLISVPLLGAVTIENMIRHYEFVRQNMQLIVPWFPENLELDLMADGTPHNLGLIPLLGYHAPSTFEGVIPNPCDVEAVIDEWFNRTPLDTIREMLAGTRCPSWSDLQAAGRLPNRAT